MRVKATAASVLVLLSLLVSCFTSACAVRCGLGQLSGHCLGSAPMRMSAMQSMEVGASASTLAPPAAATTPCEEQVCVEAPVAVQVTAHPDHLRHALVLTLLQKLVSASWPSEYRGTPPLPGTTPVSFHTVLRV